MKMKALTFFGLLAATTLTAAPRWDNPPAKTFPGLVHRTFHSRLVKGEVGFNIDLPPRYAAAGADTRYPVIYHLSGMGDHESTELSIVALLDQAIRSGKVTSLILVMVNGGSASFYADSADATNPVESMIMGELIPHIDANFRTRASREGRALHGFSMGGFGALKLAFKYPESFSAVVAYSAGLYDGAMLKEKLQKVITGQFGGDPGRFDRESPKQFARQNADQIRGRIAIRLAVGSRERLLELCRVTHRYLDELHIPHEYEEINGVAHDADVMYEKAGTQGLQFLARHFSGSQ